MTNVAKALREQDQANTAKRISRVISQQWQGASLNELVACINREFGGMPGIAKHMKDTFDDAKAGTRAQILKLVLGMNAEGEKQETAKRQFVLSSMSKEDLEATLVAIEQRVASQECGTVMCDVVRQDDDGNADPDGE